MISFMDKTFCPFWRDCITGTICARALTPEIEKSAVGWWGSEHAPISKYSTEPECFESHHHKIFHDWMKDHREEINELKNIAKIRIEEYKNESK